jgi:hypothetical protein
MTRSRNLAVQRKTPHISEQHSRELENQKTRTGFRPLRPSAKASTALFMDSVHGFS